MTDYSKKYDFAVHTKDIANALREIAGTLPSMRTPEVWKQCFGAIDLTTLNATDTVEKVRTLTERVNRLPEQFAGLPPVAAICVYPALVPTVRETLTVASVQIAAVGAGFPASQTFLSVKCDECRLAVEQGATEIDIVLSLGAFLAGDYATAAYEIMQIQQAIGNAHLKVILETGALSPSQIADAAFLAMEAGADFIKTSTGKTNPAATPEAAWIMTQCIRRFYMETGRKVGFKPAGGIVSSDDAALYYAIVRHVLGDEWLTPALFRLGASRMANNLLGSLTGKTITYF
ncbi:MAG: deoxyribose-phosphate aldolase [Prevotellaceae bacterium]|jgi:deoxyribose-phosphate aldolase|nr:deoxyribose-phosphate aldolase [Prevotellaceae bacterium]